MEYYDQHLHTYFSFDSDEKFENYLVQSNGYFVSTEHLEFNNPYTGQDDIFDYKSYKEKIDDLNKSYNNRLLKGVEIGYHSRNKEQLKEYFSDKDFDLRLLSFHHNGIRDYMSEGVKNEDPYKVMDEYFTLMIEGLEEYKDANVLAHFDYGLRYLDVSVNQFKDAASQQLDKVLDMIIKNNIALELNTKSMYRYKNHLLYEFVLDKYLLKNGQLITVSSDAHFSKDYRFMFNKVFDMLNSREVTKLATFKNNMTI